MKGFRAGSCVLCLGSKVEWAKGRRGCRGNGVPEPGSGVKELLEELLFPRPGSVAQGHVKDVWPSQTTSTDR